MCNLTNPVLVLIAAAITITACAVASVLDEIGIIKRTVFTYLLVFFLGVYATCLMILWSH